LSGLTLGGEQPQHEVVEDDDSKVRLALKPFWNHILSGEGYENSVAVLCQVPLMNYLPEDPHTTPTILRVDSLEFADGRTESPPKRVTSGWKGLEYLTFVVDNSSFRAEMTLLQEGPSGDEPLVRLEVNYLVSPGSKETTCTGFRELYTYHAVDVHIEDMPEVGPHTVLVEGCQSNPLPDWRGRTLAWVPDHPCEVRVVLRDAGLRAQSPWFKVDRSTDSLSIKAPKLSTLATYLPLELDELQADIEQGTNGCTILAQGDAEHLERCLGWRVEPVQAELDAALEALDDLKEE
jgi:hypothetical protein